MMKRRTIAIGAVIILGVCIVLAIVTPPPNPATPTSTPASVPTRAAQATATSIATATVRAASTATAAPATAGKVGDMIESGGIAVGIASVQKATKFGIWDAKAGQTFIAVEAVIQNVSRDTTPYNPLYFKLKDADGFEYTMTIGGAEPGLKSGELAKGDKVRGMVTFEAPASAKGFRITYQPLVLLGGYRVITIDLGQ